MRHMKTALLAAAALLLTACGGAIAPEATDAKGEPATWTCPMPVEDQCARLTACTILDYSCSQDGLSTCISTHAENAASDPTACHGWPVAYVFRCACDAGH